MRWFDEAVVRERLRLACKKAGSQSAWADSHGVSAAYVCDVLFERRAPGPALLSALKLERAMMYREVGK